MARNLSNHKASPVTEPSQMVGEAHAMQIERGRRSSRRLPAAASSKPADSEVGGGRL